MAKFFDVDGVQAPTGGIATQYGVTNVHDTTPTQAEVITQFGAIAGKPNGWLGTINDADGNTNLYLICKMGTKYGFLKFTVCA